MFDARDVTFHRIPVYRVIHERRSFVYTAPKSYRCGFSCGFNAAEKVNFALPNRFSGRQSSASTGVLERPLHVPRVFISFHEALANIRIQRVLNDLDRGFESVLRPGRDLGQTGSASNCGSCSISIAQASEAGHVTTELPHLMEEGESGIFAHGPEDWLPDI
jgi:hypothetical protein